MLSCRLGLRGDDTNAKNKKKIYVTNAYPNYHHGSLHLKMIPYEMINST
jgi:hypothetical protein